MNGSNIRKSFNEPVGMNGSNFKNETLFLYCFFYISAYLPICLSAYLPICLSTSTSTSTFTSTSTSTSTSISISCWELLRDLFGILCQQGRLRCHNTSKSIAVMRHDSQQERLQPTCCQVLRCISLGWGGILASPRCFGVICALTFTGNRCSEHLEIIILLIYGKTFNKAAGVLLTLAKLWQTRKSLFVFLIFNPVNRAREMQHNRYRQNVLQSF